MQVLSESSREVALRRFHLLQLHLERGVTLSRIAEEAGIDFRTVTRWLARLSVKPEPQLWQLISTDQDKYSLI
jgi:AraC-like DNA-binding protein